MTSVNGDAPSGRAPHVLLVTTRSDDRHLGGSAMRFAMTRRALLSIGTVNVVLYDDAPRERLAPWDAATPTLITLRSRRRPGRLLLALQPALARWRVIDRLILGRWTAVHPIDLADVDVVWFFKMSTVVRWQASMPANAAVVVDFDDLEENTRLHRSRLTAWFDRSVTAGLRRRLSKRSDCVTFCSDLDVARAGLRDARVLPNAVATPDPARLTELPLEPRILFVARWDYQPNREALEWFVRQVLPDIRERIPEAIVRIVGPGSEHLAADVLGCVDAVGAMDSLEPLYAWARICIAPLRTGSGTRVKILEAMAHMRPVVTTPVGLEGIDATWGVDCLVAQSREDFGAACITALSDLDLSHRLAASGRALVESRYSSAAFDAAVRAATKAARTHRDAPIRRQ